ncbi:beta-galactosidase [Microbacterium trichothecenolyticum]|uniref:beta-galactosidase n=1 Tax=Microbacterium trichothecenolyticum TaxID=69370 RepID=UPI00285E831F|nr:beta-galactosidase [Microbacterium trichothecenolyticum]MDR7113103.1 beta-galactosidase [Microbacterium trichothecenolyticum]
MASVDRLRAWRGGPRLGTAYYNEYLPDPDRLETDLRLMTDAGITCIRVGESVWSTWEPRDGEFDLEWMTPILDAAERHGIAVILGTPTYAVPPWLARAHPELAVVRRDGSRVPWGGRQEADYTSELFRGYAERVIRAVVGRHGRHPAVIGVQLDNEAGLHLIHNDAVVQRFREWVAERYGDVETLNREWGLTYWSHRIADWDELWAPAGNTTPAYDLAWRRFQAELTADFIGWQAGIVRELVDDDTFLTTCIAYQRPAMDDVAVGARLDIASGNAYYLAQDALDLSLEGAGGNWYADDVPQLVLMADRMRATTQGPFLVTETGAASIGPAWLTRPPYDGQLAQAAWLLVARGARLVSYWHWHTLHSGAEVHWGGIVGHDLSPGRVYDEISGIGRQFAAAAEWLTDAAPDADLGLVSAHDSEWMMAFEPPLAAGPEGDRGSYARIVGAFGRAAIDAGLQVGFVNERQLPEADELVRRYPVLVVAGLVAASDPTLETLAEYARLGGRLVLGPRTGYGDDEGRMRTALAPAIVGAAAGVGYREFAALAAPVDVVRDGEIVGSAHGWVDGLEPDGAEVVLGYRHELFGRWAAVTRRDVGAGSITVVGSLLDRATLAEVIGDVAGSPDGILAARPSSVTAHSLTGERGRVWVVHNWSSEPRAVVLGRAAASVLDDAVFAAGAEVTLAPWDVRVWREA